MTYNEDARLRFAGDETANRVCPVLGSCGRTIETERRGRSERDRERTICGVCFKCSTRVHGF